MGRRLESAAGRAFSIGEISRHETRRGGVPHGGGMSGRSRTLTTRYHVHGTAVGRARGARVALDGPCSPDHRGRPIGADPARRRERRPGCRDHPCGDAPPRRRTPGLRPRRSPHLREARRPGVPHSVRRRHRAHEPVHAVPGASSSAASRRAGLRDVGDARRARGGARAPAAGWYAGVRAAARRLRSYCEIVREYPVSGRSWKSDPATASMVATYWFSFRVSATPIVTTAPFVSFPVTANRVTMVRGWEKTRDRKSVV